MGNTMRERGEGRETGVGKANKKIEEEKNMDKIKGRKELRKKIPTGYEDYEKTRHMRGKRKKIWTERLKVKNKGNLESEDNNKEKGTRSKEEEKEEEEKGEAKGR